MRNVIKRSFIALVIIALGCKKSGPGLDAKTLCDGLAPFRATATVGEMIEGTTRTVPVDTIVNFQALLQAQSNAPSTAVDYEWLISNSGSQPTRYRQPTFLLRFGPEQIGERIDVILIAKRLDASPPCPNEDNIDTVRRSFYIYTNNKADTLLHRPFIVENKIIGRWRGSYTDDPQRQFIVTITDFGFPPVLDSTTYYGVRLFNMPEGCGNRPSWASNPCAFAIAPSSYSHPIDYGGSSFAVNQPFTNDCGCTPISLYGYIPYNKRDSLVMDVRLHQVGTGNIERNRQWKGKRL